MENREATLERSERHTAPAKKSYRMAKIDLIAEQSLRTISKSGATDADEYKAGTDGASPDGSE